MSPVDDRVEWPHPDRCPGGDCRGQFFWLKDYGMICTVRLVQLTGGSVVKLIELSHTMRVEKAEGCGLA